jgi:hypothetical protein
MGAHDYFTNAKGTLSSTFQITPGTVPGPPTTGAHDVGEVYTDSTGQRYLCVASGTPGSWCTLPDIAHVNKPVDTSRANDNTPTADPHLTLPLEPNTTYIARAAISAFSLSAFPDLLLGLTFPGDATASLKMWGSRRDSGVNVDGRLFDTSGAAYQVDVESGGETSIFFDGIINTGATAGNLTVIWSQNVSRNDAMVMKALSYMELTRR